MGERIWGFPQVGIELIWFGIPSGDELAQRVMLDAKPYFHISTGGKKYVSRPINIHYPYCKVAPSICIEREKGFDSNTFGTIWIFPKNVLGDIVYYKCQ